MDVASYIRATASLPFLWGITDCLVWPAGWVFEATGTDPAERLRETYDSAAGAARICREAGGMASLIHGQTLCLLMRDDAAEDGVCLAVRDKRPFGGLISRGRVMLKTDGGVMMHDGEPLAVWRLP